MDTRFMNSKNSKSSDPHRLLLIFSDKINLKRSDKCIIHCTWKNIKKVIQKQ